MTSINQTPRVNKGYTSIQDAIREAMTSVACADACLLGREGVSEAMEFHREAIKLLQFALGSNA